jgi:hypothetical protein
MNAIETLLNIRANHHLLLRKEKTSDGCILAALAPRVIDVNQALTR